MKKIFVGVILTLLLVGTLFSCAPTHEESKPTNNNTATFNVVIGRDFESEKFNDLYEAAGLYFGSMPEIANDTYDVSNAEIVIGKSSREISKTAYKKLENYNKNSESSSAYLVYSDGNSIAIAYQEDMFESGAALDTVIDIMIEKLGKVKLGEIPKGVVCSGEVDPIEWQTARDEANKEVEWRELSEEIGGEQGEAVVKAIKDYYSIISPEIVVWLANLYDFETGGFYYSNSARNTVGYGPDLESTHQALSFLNNMGVFEGIGNTPKNLPYWMRAALLKWVKSLQDPNGYFYHPQWDKALSNSHYSRLGRDLDHAVTLLSYCGARPTYDTPSGVKGDYTLVDGTKVDKNGNVILPTSKLTAPLSDSSVASVSQVVAVNAVPATLESETAFRAYLAGLDIKNNSYSVGNELTSQSTQFKNREAQLKAEGADWSLIGILEDWLYVNQNPENGLWYYLDESDPGWYAYEGVNGLLKISSMYNNLGMEFHYPVEAINSAIEAIYTDETPSMVCDTYNTWFAVGNVFNNLSAHAADPVQASKTIADIRATLMADAPYLIEHTGAKILQFINDDGSFSYTQASSAPTSQGMPVAVPDTKEGDVNATEICAFGTAGYMFNALGITVPKRFGTAEWYTFIGTIYELGDIVKDEAKPAEPENFDDYGTDELPEGIDATIKSGGSASIVNDPRGSGKIFRFDSKNDGGDSLYFEVPYSPATACFVYESEMCIESGDETYVSQLWLSNNYMLGFRIEGDRVNIFDSSSQGSPRLEQDFGMTVGLNEWFKLRVEYYTGDHDTVRIKVYINNELCVVSDNYYDYYGVKLTEGVGEPYNGYYSIAFVGFSTANVTILIDDLLITKTRDQYIPELDPDDQPLYFNIDAPDRERVVHSFDDSSEEYGEGLAVTDGKLLIESGKYAEIPLNLISNKGKTFSFRGDICFSDVQNSSVTLTLVDSEGSVIATIVAAPDGNGKVNLSQKAEGEIIGVAELAEDNSFNLGVDYYPEKGMILLYGENTLCGSCDATRYISGLPDITLTRLEPEGDGINILLDNAWFERKLSSFDVATAPEGKSKIEKFEGTPEEAQISSGVEITNDGGMKYAVVSNGGQITLPINVRSNLQGTVVFGASLFMPKDITSSSCLNIALCDENGNKLIAFAITKSGLCELTKNNMYSPIATLPIGQFFDFTFEFYLDRDLAKIFVEGKLVAISSILYTPDADLSLTESVIIESTSGYFSVDNIYLEGYYKPYKTEAVAADKEQGETLGFDSSTTGSISDRISLDSLISSIGINESLRSGAYGKVLAFRSKSGSYDSLYVNLSAEKEAYNTTSFEADMMISYNSLDTTSCEFMFSDKKNGLSYLLILYADTDGMLHIWDMSNHSGAGRVFGRDVNIGVSADEWFHLRMEYRHGSRSTVEIITYVNGDPVYESTNFYGKSTLDPYASPYGTINRFRISTYTATDATVYLDNVYFERETLGIPGAPDTPVGPPEDGAVISYESSTTSNLPLRVTAILASAGAEVRIDELMRAQDNKNALAFKTAAGNNDNLYIGKTLTASNKNATVFETEIKISYDEGTADKTFELDLCGEGNTRAYLLLMSHNGENITFWDVSGISSSAVPGRVWGDVKTSSAKADEWFKLRVEYIYGDAESVRILTYVNDTLVLESNNFYGKSTQNKNAVPLSSVTTAYFSSYSSTSATMYLDNTLLQDADVEKENSTVQPEPTPTPGTDPEPSEGEAIIDFESEDVSSKIVYTEGSANSAGNTSFGGVVADTTGNKTNVYKFAVDQNSGTNIVVNTTKSAEGDNVFVFETDIDPTFSDNGTPIFYVYFRDSEGRYVYALQVMKDTDNTLSMYDISTWDWKSVNGSKITLPDGWFNLKVEYYANANKSDVRIKLYVDGTPVYISSNIFTSFSYADYSSMSSVMIQFYSNATAELRLDNTGLYSMSKEFSED